MYATLFATISATEVVSGFKNIRMDTAMNKALAILETNNDLDGKNIYLVAYTLGGDLQLLRYSQSYAARNIKLASNGVKLWLNFENVGPDDLVSVSMKFDPSSGLFVVEG